MKNSFAAVGILLLASVGGFMFYMGLLNEWLIDQKPFGPWQVVYLEQEGSYGQTGSSIEKVSEALAGVDVEPQFALAVFYSNPDNLPEDELKSEAGFVLAKDDLPKIRGLSSEFKTRELQRKMYVFTDFPNRNFLSYFIGPMMCYSRLENYCEDLRLEFNSSVELYRNDRIYYLVPKSRKPD